VVSSIAWNYFGILHERKNISEDKKVINAALFNNIDDFLHVELLCNDQVFFEILKMKIRSVSIAYSIRKSRDEKEKTLKLENDIQLHNNST
jgi:hypothetical protein